MQSVILPYRPPSTITIHEFKLDSFSNDRGNMSMSSHLPQSQQKQHRPVIDVMSIASDQRPHYWQAQQQTWASHPSVRNFWAVTEQDDGPEWRNCSQNMTVEDVTNYIVTCRNLHNTPFLRQYRFFPRGFILRKSNPAGWLCAQIRPGTALAKLGEYYVQQSNDNLPDFALLVDDDTMFQMNLLEDHLHRTTTTKAPVVWAGCLNVSPLGVDEIDRFSPFGGAGTVWSKEALRRLLQPIHCHPTNDNSVNKSTTSLFVQQVCNRIQENLILESNLFEEGMRMFEFIQKVYLKSPNCFHSDWLLGHFIHYYYLSEPTTESMDSAWWDAKKQGRLLPLHDPDSVGVFNNTLAEGSLCQTTQQKKPTDDTCNKESLVCHYVNPDWMAKVTSQWMGNNNG
jgi:hypothetical protein